MQHPPSTTLTQHLKNVGVCKGFAFDCDSLVAEKADMKRNFPKWGLEDGVHFRLYQKSPEKSQHAVRSRTSSRAFAITEITWQHTVMSVESSVPPKGTLVKTVLDYFTDERANAYYYTKPMPNLGEYFERFLPPEEFAMYGFLNKMRLEKHGERFPVYLDPYAAMMGQRQDNVLSSIKSWYKEETDYITSTQELTDTDLGIPFPASREKSVTTPVMGRPREHVYISLFCAQAYAMRTKSAKGEQTRSLFIHLAEIAGIYETEQTQRSKAALTLKAKSDQILENFPDGQKVFYTGYAGLLKGRGETEPTPKGKVGFTDVSLTDRHRAHVQEYGDFWLTSAIPMAYPAELEKNLKQSRVFRNSQIDIPYGEEGKCWSELFDVSKVTMDQMIKHAKKLSKDMTSLGGGSSIHSTELALTQLGLERDREKTKQAEAETRKVEAEQKTKQMDAQAEVAKEKTKQMLYEKLSPQALERLLLGTHNISTELTNTAPMQEITMQEITTPNVDVDLTVPPTLTSPTPTSSVTVPPTSLTDPPSSSPSPDSSLTVLPSSTSPVSSLTVSPSSPTPTSSSNIYKRFVTENLVADSSKGIPTDVLVDAFQKWRVDENDIVTTEGGKYGRNTVLHGIEVAIFGKKCNHDARKGTVPGARKIAGLGGFHLMT